MTTTPHPIVAQPSLRDRAVEASKARDAAADVALQQEQAQTRAAVASTLIQRLADLGVLACHHDLTISDGDGLRGRFWEARVEHDQFTFIARRLPTRPAMTTVLVQHRDGGHAEALPTDLAALGDVLRKLEALAEDDRRWLEQGAEEHRQLLKQQEAKS